MFALGFGVAGAGRAWSPMAPGLLSRMSLLVRRDSGHVRASRRPTIFRPRHFADGDGECGDINVERLPSAWTAAQYADGAAACVLLGRSIYFEFSARNDSGGGRMNTMDNCIAGAKFLILGLAVVISILVHHEIAWSAPRPSPGTSGLTSTVEETAIAALETSEKVKARLDKLESRAVWLGSIAVIGLAVLGVFGYQFMRNTVRDFAGRKLEAITRSAVSENLPALLESVQHTAETHLLKLAQLLALRSSKDFDEALTAYGWAGSVPELRQKSPLERRAVIECLHGAKRNRKENREAAWKALLELAEEDSSIETLRLFLYLAISQRKHGEGVRLFEKHKSAVVADIAAAIRASTLLRKVGRTEEALKVARPLAESGDLGAILTVAALERDEGEFTSVHDMLVPHVNRMLKLHDSELPEAWHRLLNTFVANCLDRGHVEDGVDSARFMLKRQSGSVTVYTAARLIHALPRDHKERDALASALRAVIDDLVPTEEATIQCRATLFRIEGHDDQAMDLLQRQISSGEAEKGKAMAPDRYFYRCNFGAMLTENGRASEAIDVLLPAVENKYGGEAKYHLAAAYARLGEGKDAARWLRLAIEELPKWAEYARDNEHLRKTTDVQEVLADFSKRRVVG